MGWRSLKITDDLSMQYFGFCVLKAPWRDLPADYGGWSNTHRRFIRWRDAGRWEKLLEVLIDSPDFEWLMIDASHIKVHPHAAGAKGGNQKMSRTKGGSTQNYIWPWMRLVCRSESFPYMCIDKVADYEVESFIVAHTGNGMQPCKNAQGTADVEFKI